MKLFLTSLIFFLSLANAVAGDGAAPECRFQDLSHPDHFEVSDPCCDEFFGSAEVMPHENGYLPSSEPGHRTLDINFQFKNAARRSAVLRGKEQYARVLQHFEGKFDQILGLFVAPVGKGELSDNLATVNTLTGPGKGLGIEEAVLQSWFGQRAMESGFSQVRILQLDGEPGSYTSVKVVFVRPPR